MLPILEDYMERLQALHALFDGFSKGCRHRP
jgi:hypothetical protein